MQYAVPQFTDVEDKLIGFLTLKQFLFLLATGGMDLFFYSLLQFSLFFFFFAAPITILGIAVAFGKFNGRPMYSYISVFISFVSKPQARIFRREEPNTIIRIDKPKKMVAVAVDTEPAESRLRKLAYLLDQKTEEEEELIKKVPVRMTMAQTPQIDPNIARIYDLQEELKIPKKNIESPKAKLTPSTIAHEFAEKLRAQKIKLEHPKKVNPDSEAKIYDLQDELNQKPG